MKLLRSFFLLSLLALSLSATAAVAEEDTEENRKLAADKYLKVYSLSELFGDMANQMGQAMPAEQRKAFIETMTKNIDTVSLQKVMKTNLVKHFTVSELNAMTVFLSSTEGKSAMKKLGAYMRDCMPAIQQEVMKAVQKTQAGAK